MTETANKLDPRIHPVREDLAAMHLKGRFTAKNYATGVPYQVAVPTVFLREKPAAPPKLGNAVTELLFGEIFTVYEEKNGWCWGQCETDDYVGYIPAEALSKTVISATHYITAPHTLLYTAPDFRTVPDGTLSMGTRLHLTGKKEKCFAEIHTGQWVAEQHIMPASQILPDYVETALRYLHSPHHWGGRSGLGLDCSALVQIPLLLAGHQKVMRDTDLQRDTLGETVEFSADKPLNAPYRRGDLVYFPGHVGIMTDEQNLLHSNDRSMNVIVEPLAGVIEWIARKHAAPVTAIRRFHL